MAEISAATWTTFVRGHRVELPATIDGIRAALPEAERSDFDTEVGATRGEDLHRVLGHWALRTHPEAVAEMEEEFARLEAGDYTGVTFLDDDQDQGAA